MRYYYPLALLLYFMGTGLAGQSSVSLAVGVEHLGFRTGASESHGALVSALPKSGLTASLGYFIPNRHTNSGFQIEGGFSTVKGSRLTASEFSSGGGYATTGTFSFRKINVAIIRGSLIGKQRKGFLGAGLYVSYDGGNREVLLRTHWSNPFGPPSTNEQRMLQSEVLRKVELGLQLRASYTILLSNTFTISPELGSRFAVGNIANFENRVPLYPVRVDFQIRISYLL